MRGPRKALGREKIEEGFFLVAVRSLFDRFRPARLNFVLARLGPVWPLQWVARTSRRSLRVLPLSPPRQRAKGGPRALGGGGGGGAENSRSSSMASKFLRRRRR